jgi:hypothetical protein
MSPSKTSGRPEPQIVVLYPTPNFRREFELRKDTAPKKTHGPFGEVSQINGHLGAMVISLQERNKGRVWRLLIIFAKFVADFVTANDVV